MTDFPKIFIIKEDKLSSRRLKAKAKPFLTKNFGRSLLLSFLSILFIVIIIYYSINIAIFVTDKSIDFIADDIFNNSFQSALNGIDNVGGRIVVGISVGIGCATLIVFFTILLTFFYFFIIFSVVYFLILKPLVSGPFSVGICKFYITPPEEKASMWSVFLGFKKYYLRNAKIHFLMGVKKLLWTFLFIIPGIIKSYEYAMIPYILADSDGISVKDAFMLSKAMMHGNKFKLFSVKFSFFGWGILSFFTFGLGTIFALSYYKATLAEFYKELKNMYLSHGDYDCK